MGSHRVFSYPVTIREGHLDTYGHVNNAAYLELFEEARWEIVTPQGFGLEAVRQTLLGPIVLEIHLRFLKELKLRMQVTIKTQLVSYVGKVGVLRHWIEGTYGDVLCDGELKMGLFDLRARKLVDPTPQWLQAIGADPAQLAP